ncbi:MAG: 2-isopropylmalate synthase [Pseudomonadota bacterium]
MYNYHPDRVLIFDTTLRDGEQSPGATMNHAEKLEIAGLLETMGVDIIEAGFPIASEGDFAAVRDIAKNSTRAVICGLARAKIKDIDRCWEAIRHAPRPRIHTFIGTSPLHRAIPDLSKDEMADLIGQTVRHARNLCEDVQWSPMDATRTEWDYLVHVIDVAIQAGATTINIPDTVGYTAPAESRELIQRLVNEVPNADKIVFATHCHNDLGMATANALAAVQGGARQIECTVNGLGERAGNTALEEVVMAMKVRSDILPFHTGIDARTITKLSRRVSAVSGFAVQPNKAIVGKNAFAHESGIHQDGMLKNAETFEIMRPEDVGLTETNLVMGKHSGRAALRNKLEGLGFKFDDQQLGEVFARFKVLADRKKEIFEEDLMALMQQRTSTESRDHIQLKYLRLICGTELPQSADLVLQIDGRDHSVTAQGDGPVDAAFNAVKAIFPHTAKLTHYHVRAVTGGTDAQATVDLRISDAGRYAAGQSADTDTVVASTRAYVNALNDLVAQQRKVPVVERKQNLRDLLPVEA